MANILGMEFKPDFIEIQTWNDGSKSHNIGNFWPESYSDTQPSFYMKEHDGWRSLFTSFIAAWKSKGSVSLMVPQNSQDPAIGAMWYTALPIDAACPFDDGIINGSIGELFWGKPFGFDSGVDAVNWALVVSPLSAGSTLQVFSGGILMDSVPLAAG